MTHTRFLVSSWRLMLVNIVGRKISSQGFPCTPWNPRSKKLQMWSLRDCDCTSFMTAYVGCAVLPLAVGTVLVLPVWIAWKVLTEGSTQRRGVMSSLLQRCGCWTSAWVWIWARNSVLNELNHLCCLPSQSSKHSKAHRLSTEQFPGLKVRASWTASSAFEVCIKRFTTHTGSQRTAVCINIFERTLRLHLLHLLL